ncbi:MAG: diguanylate cyclase [Chloroflexota bacterium]|nr:MAG: diguanylate cyclase [Chloroflexota bacterium]
MGNLSVKAKAFILFTIGAGLALSFWNLWQIQAGNLWLLAALSFLAAVTHILKVEGPTGTSSYQISFMVYGFTLVLMGTEELIFVILAAHIIEWLWHRYPWFIQSFNYGSFVITATVTGLAYERVSNGFGPLTFNGVVAILAAMAVFTLTNHLMIGLVIWLARGENFAESDVFDTLPLMIDFSLFGLGIGASVIWLTNPYAVVLVIIPLYLIYSTLKVPALMRQAETDSKTGLFNSKFFMQALDMELARAERFERPLTVVMGDLDLLRNINNSYGHLAGDKVIIGVSQIMKNIVRDYDIVSRFGGEEFAILMPETEPEQALMRVEAIRVAVEAARFEVPTSATPIKATISLGISGRYKTGQTANEIIHSADQALYHCKSRGRNRVVLFTRSASFKSANPTVPLKMEGSTEIDGKRPAQQAVLDQKDQNKKNRPDIDKLGKTRFKKETRRVNIDWIQWYITAISLVALYMLLNFTQPLPVIDWIGLGVFSLVVLLSEGLSIDLYDRNTSISTSAAPMIAGTLLFGPLGVLVFSLVQALTAFIKYKSPTNRFFFNASNQIIGGLLCIAFINFTGLVLPEISVPLQLLFTLVSAVIIYISTTSLVTFAIFLTSRDRLKMIWDERFRWLGPYYIGMGIVAYALIFTYHSAGFLGVFVLLVPLFILRLSQKQYIDRTKDVVTQLKENNKDLQQQADEISRLNDELMLVLSQVIDIRDPYVLGHSQRVAHYANKIAKRIGLSEEAIDNVVKAALLHDIGKLGVPDAILLKEGSLNEQEYAIVKQHSGLGAQIIRSCHSLKALIPAVYHHHESYNGKGYPDGLSGDEIPLEARILGLADAIEAMATDRPYHRALESEEILAEIQRRAGSQFDPVLVNSFISIVREEGLSVIINSANKREAGKALIPTIWESVTKGGAYTSI